MKNQLCPKATGERTHKKIKLYLISREEKFWLFCTHLQSLVLQIFLQISRNIIMVMNKNMKIFIWFWIESWHNSNALLQLLMPSHIHLTFSDQFINSFYLCLSSLSLSNSIFLSVFFSLIFLLVLPSDIHMTFSDQFIIIFLSFPHLLSLLHFTFDTLSNSFDHLTEILRSMHKLT